MRYDPDAALCSHLVHYQDKACIPLDADVSPRRLSAVSLYSLAFIRRLYSTHPTIMQPSSSCRRHLSGHFIAPAILAAAVLWPLDASAATAQEVSATVRRQVAAQPADGPAILEKNLRALPENERTRYASGALASSLDGVEKNSDRVLHHYEAAVAAAPTAVLGLMEVAHRAAPDRIVEITEIALEQTTRKAPRRKRDFKDVVPPGERDFKGGRDAADAYEGREDLVSSILNKAIALAPDQRSALLGLVRGMYPTSFADRVFASIGGVALAPGFALGGGALGGTINPANIGGSASGGGSDNKGGVKAPAEPDDVSPSE
jgi:hypothetical protein